MEKTVMTVGGPIPVGRLGVTLMHEHITFAYPGWFADDRSLESTQSSTRPLPTWAAVTLF